MAFDLIFSAFFKAIAQFRDSRFRIVMLRGLGLTLALLVTVFFGLRWLLNLALASNWFEWLGASGWVGSASSVLAFLLTTGLALFAMIPVAAAFVSIFLDDVADAVEARHYPELTQAPPIPLAEGLRDGLSAFGLLIVGNLLALVLYVFFPPAGPFIFFALNGFLLGREYFTLAAMRRIGRAGAKDLRKRHRATIWAAGVLMALPLTVPILNLVIPILGAATFTHIFHGLHRG